MTDASRDVAVWRGIVEAMEGFDADLERAFAAPSPDLAALHRRTRSRLEGLRDALKKLRLSEGDCEDVLRPLAFLVDERVLGRLAGESLAAQQQWSLVQRAVTNELYGGDEFFAAADAVIARTPVARLHLEVYLYCLGRGFVGKYADAPEELERYRARLWEPLKGEIPATTGGPARGEPVRVPRRRGLARFWILAAAGCTVVAMFYASVAGYRLLMSRSL